MQADAGKAGFPKVCGSDAVYQWHPISLGQLVHALEEEFLRTNVLPDEMLEHGVAAEFLMSATSR